MRFVVFGAGAIGGVVGGRLAQHGQDVVLIARGAHLAAIRDQGLRLLSPDDEVVVDVPAVGSPAEVDWRQGDVVLLCVKSQDTENALEALRAALPDSMPHVPVACLQNGVESERRALRLFPDVYGVLVMLPAVYTEPGVVESRSAPVTGALNIGRYPGSVDATAEEIAEAFRKSTLLSEVTAEIMAQKHAKLLMNLGNSVVALSGGDGLRGPIAQRCRAEARAVLAAGGVAVAPDGFDAAQREHVTIRPVPGRTGRIGSTWQSFARGADRIETDFLNGEIVLLSRLYGVPAPVNAALQRLADRALRAGLPPGSMTEDELDRAIDSETARS